MHRHIKLIDIPITNIIQTMYYLNDSILRTRGARGIFMKSELEKNAILRRASRFVGTSVADSLTVKRR